MSTAPEVNYSGPQLAEYFARVFAAPLSRPVKRSLTPLARKFGAPHKTKIARVLKDYNHKVKKSGHTPLTPWKIGDTLPSEQRLSLRGNIKKYQQSLQRGFDGAELLASESLAHYQEVRVPNLTNPIHPIFARERWQTRETLPKYQACEDIGDGSLGQWHAGNPVVWDMLKPCLQLASLMISNSHCWRWWDALMWADRETVDMADNTRAQMFCFRRRPDKDFVLERERTHMKFIELSQALKFRIYNGNAGVESLRPKGSTGPEAVTYYDFREDGPRICLSYLLLSPLARKDLTVAETLLTRWTVAETLIHECAHAMGQYKRHGHAWQVTDMSEAYFEDEVLDELGYSATYAMTNGFLVPIVPLPTRGVPTFGYFTRAWPDASDYSSSGLARGPLQEFADLYPVPIKWFEQVFQENFWDYQIRKFGVDALHYGPLTNGRRLPAFVDDLADYGWSLPLLSHEDDRPLTADMPGDLLARVKLENERRRTGRRVLAALLANKDQMDALKKAVHRERHVETQYDNVDLLTGDDNLSVSTEDIPILLSEFMLPADDDSESSDDDSLEALAHLDSGTFLPWPTVEYGIRYQEIRRFFLQNRYNLGLQGRKGPIPEVLLRDYCARLDPPMLISGIEFRQFMTSSHERRDLFWQVSLSMLIFGSC
ncbi:MAG: hypothetical protein M1818_006003 [Claussenomyces sp. TS43310]|nr:MAG: hypothetical protein M1818_006003 [Claussenomyces sp. TS43310]